MGKYVKPVISAGEKIERDIGEFQKSEYGRETERRVGQALQRFGRR